jgi:cytochrome c peroxidase
LFYDARLSLDGWYSCHSCHTDGHTSGLLSDNLGDGGYGAPKRVLSLLGAGDTGPWAWNGTIPTLESQIRKSIESTMQGRKPRDEQVAALAAYLRTLTPPPALDSLRGKTDAAAIERGRKTFESRGCASCHVPPSYASADSFDVSLKDELGATHFNPPSLRGVSQRGPYFHDNCAATLESVLIEHRHPPGSSLSAEELCDLIAFLNSI